MHFATLAPTSLQALPCPGEADMVPEASIASSVLCVHVARSALTPASWLSIESVVPLVEAGTARCSMAASANLKQVATAALSALLTMLAASASLPASSLSPVRAPATPVPSSQRTSSSAALSCFLLLPHICIATFPFLHASIAAVSSCSSMYSTTRGMPATPASSYSAGGILLRHSHCCKLPRAHRPHTASPTSCPRTHRLALTRRHACSWPAACCAAAAR